MADYILFLDEIKNNDSNPYFCLAGFSISRWNYENKLIPVINEFKKKHFDGDTGVLFHFNEMKKQINGFELLQDGTFRVTFWQELHKLLKNIPFFTFGCYFNSLTIDTIYPNRSTSAHALALHFIVENFIHQLRTNKGVGSIMIESRTFKENQQLNDYFHMIEANGTVFYHKDDVRKYVASLGYIIKKDNCIGLQVADMIPHSFINIVSGSSDFYNFGNLFSNKLYGKNKGNQDILGLKSIL